MECLSTAILHTLLLFCISQSQKPSPPTAIPGVDVTVGQASPHFRPITNVTFTSSQHASPARKLDLHAYPEGHGKVAGGNKVDAAAYHEASTHIPAKSKRESRSKNVRRRPWPNPEIPFRLLPLLYSSTRTTPLFHLTVE